MKNYTGYMILLGILLSINLNAQESQRIGHINVLEVISVLPETDSVQLQIEKDRRDLELMLEEMQVEYNKLVDKYQKNIDTYSDLIRSAKEADIIEMKNKIQAFYENSSQQLQERNAELMQPIYERIQLAIDRIASEENFSYILDLSKGAVAFTGNNSHNMDSLVLRELGILDQN